MEQRCRDYISKKLRFNLIIYKILAGAIAGYTVFAPAVSNILCVYSCIFTLILNCSLK